MENIKLPAPVIELMSLLRSHQYESMVAGDAARELLMGNNPMDYDIITNCEMERLLIILDGYRINEDNIDRGELIVTVRGMVIMVSPYRKEFDADGHPVYTNSPAQEMARRDFTMNAVGITMEGELYDPFGGAVCLESEPYIIKAVGESQDFPLVAGLVEPGAENEGSVMNYSSVANDPSILLKALSMAATGDYIIDDTTKKNIIISAGTVNSLLPWELLDAFSEILLAKRCNQILTEYKEVVFAIFPELAPTDGFNQHSEYHQSTLYEHTCKSVFLAPPEADVRYALFFHGIGKPDCEVIWPDGHATFFGHDERGIMLTRRALERLKMPKEQLEEITFLLRHHDLADSLKTEDIDRLLETLQPYDLRKLLLVGYANLRAKRPEYEQKATALKRLSEQVLHWNEPTNNKFRVFI